MIAQFTLSDPAVGSLVIVLVGVRKTGVSVCNGSALALASSYLQIPPVLSSSGVTLMFGPSSLSTLSFFTNEKYLRSQVLPSSFSFCLKSRWRT